jgi:hypothetical protein
MKNSTKLQELQSHAFFVLCSIRGFEPEPLDEDEAAGQARDYLSAAVEGRDVLTVEEMTCLSPAIAECRRLAAEPDHNDGLPFEESMANLEPFMAEVREIDMMPPCRETRLPVYDFLGDAKA